MDENDIRFSMELLLALVVVVASGGGEDLNASVGRFESAVAILTGGNVT
jgi:hypothetical protein